LGFNGQSFSYLGSITAEFNGPSGASAGARGIIVVADTGNNRIVVLNSQGNLLVEYDQPNDGYHGFFNAPRGVAIDQNGNLVVADTGNARIVTVRTIKKILLPMILHSNK